MASSSNSNLNQSQDNITGNADTQIPDEEMIEDPDAEEFSYPEDPDVRVYSIEADHEFFQVPLVPTTRELDKAYRSLARVMHPDKYHNSEWATRAFQRLQNRFERFRATIQ